MQTEYEVQKGFLEYLEARAPGSTEDLKLKGGEKLPLVFTAGTPGMRLDLPGRDLKSPHVQTLAGSETPCLFLDRHPDELSRPEEIARMRGVTAPDFAFGSVVADADGEYEVKADDIGIVALVPVDGGAGKTVAVADARAAGTFRQVRTAGAQTAIRVAKEREEGKARAAEEAVKAKAEAKAEAKHTAAETKHEAKHTAAETKVEAKHETKHTDHGHGHR